MRRTLMPVAAAVLALAGCSSGTIKSTVVPTAHVATSAAISSAPVPGTSPLGGADHTVEALECGMFDMGAVYLNDEWPAIIAGHPRMGYGLNLGRAADTWQKGLNAYSSDPSLDAAIGRAESGVNDMMAAMAQSTGSAPVEIGDQVRQIQDAFMAASGDCAGIGYNMTQPLAEK